MLSKNMCVSTGDTDMQSLIDVQITVSIHNASDCAAGDCETAGRGRLAAHHGGHPTAPPVDTV